MIYEHANNDFLITILKYHYYRIIIRKSLLALTMILYICNNDFLTMLL